MDLPFMASFVIQKTDPLERCISHVVRGNPIFTLLGIHNVVIPARYFGLGFVVLRPSLEKRLVYFFA